jgi:serine/threonine protein kinase
VYNTKKNSLHARSSEASHTKQHALSVSLRSKKVLFENPIQEVNILHYLTNECSSTDSGKTYIVQMYNHFTQDNLHCIVLEYLPKGELFSFVTTRKVRCDRTSVSLIRNIAMGIAFLHRKGIAHLDVSVENVCLTKENECKLIDFGVAIQTPPSSFSSTSPLSSSSFARTHTNSLVTCETNTLPIHVPFLSNRTCSCATAHARLYKIETLSISSGVARMCIDVRQNRSFDGLTFLCHPLCHHINQPGKELYRSPELASGHIWDAFAADCWGVGITMFTVLFGEYPLSPTHIHRGDPHPLLNPIWMNALLSSSNQNTLHREALHLLGAIFQPQQKRLTIESILMHPFFHTDPTPLPASHESPPLDIVVCNNEGI